MQSLASKARQSLRSAPEVAGSYVPLSVKQLGAAAVSGDLVRVSSLQAQAFWARFGGYIVAAGFAVLTFYIWQGLHSLCSTVVDVTNRYVSWILVGAALATGAAGYLYYRQQWVVSPRQVYNLAMFKLKQDAGVLEVLGAPVAATFPRACIVTAGGLRFKGLRLAWRSERVHMVFPLEGRARTGMVTLHAKKRRGKYRFRQLAVDVPAEDGAVQQRIIVDGDAAPPPGSAAVDDLRARLLQTLEKRPIFDKEDDEDDEQDAVLARQQAQERKKRREEAAPKPLDMGGGMYFYERVYWQVYYFNKRVKGWMLQWQTRHLGP